MVYPQERSRIDAGVNDISHWYIVSGQSVVDPIRKLGDGEINVHLKGRFGI